MKSLFHGLFCLAGILAVAACASGTVQPPTTTPPVLADSSHVTPEVRASGSTLHGVFEGITACSSQTRPLPQIPQDTDCELMIWKIVLNQDPATEIPTTYTLESTYGPSQPNSTGPAGGGTSVSMTGNWSIAKGTRADPDADVYQLYGEASQVAVSFVKLSEDLLHVLSPDKTLMLGNAAWSYTLNRTDHQVPFQLPPVSEPPLPTRPPIPATPPGSTLLGAFEGRLPCHEIVFEIARIPPYDGCARMKSRLTLFLEQATGMPGTYMHLSTHTIREGAWAIVEGMEGDPNATIYQIHMDDSQGPVSFLKIDENHLFLLDRDLNLLVGNALLSYTLSRVEMSAP